MPIEQVAGIGFVASSDVTMKYFVALSAPSAIPGAAFEILVVPKP